MSGRRRSRQIEPRLLNRTEAAAYLGRGVRTFDAEVESGLWPAPLIIGLHGRQRAWDRDALDRTVDRMSGNFVEVTTPADDNAAERQAMQKLAAAKRLQQEHSNGKTKVNRP
jgi:hypothetical protein